jgi:hypothetical protein
MKKRASLLLNVDKDNYLPDIHISPSKKTEFNKPRMSMSKKYNKYGGSKFLRNLQDNKRNTEDNLELKTSARKPVEKAKFTIPLMSEDTKEINHQLQEIYKKQKFYEPKEDLWYLKVDGEIELESMRGMVKTQQYKLGQM